MLCYNVQEIDILHPLAYLHWEECYPSPYGRLYPQCLIVRNQLYVATTCRYTMQNIVKLHVYNAGLTAWTALNTPTEQWFGISRYHSQLVIIGGLEQSSQKLTSKVWSSDNGIDWELSLPPLPTPRSSPSVVNTGSPEYLIVAGGAGDVGATHVDVLKGEQWMSAQPLPWGCSGMLHTIYNWNLYFSLYGGYGNKKSSILYCNVDSLLATTEPEYSSDFISVWKELKVPVENSTPVSFGKHMVVIGEVYTKTQARYPHITFITKICAYSPATEAWVQIGDVPYALCRPDSIALPSGDLLITGERNGLQAWKTLKASLKC